jgi:hypothetical protein
MVQDNSNSRLLFHTITLCENFQPWENIVRKNVWKLRSIAELRAFGGSAPLCILQVLKLLRYLTMPGSSYIFLVIILLPG